MTEATITPPAIELARWEDDGGRPGDIIPSTRSETVTATTATTPPPTSAEKQRMVNDAMGAVHLFGSAGSQALEVLDVATSRAFGRRMDVSRLDAAAALLREARSKVIAAETLISPHQDSHHHRDFKAGEDLPRGFHAHAIPSTARRAEL
jgi:hypothetical protein